MNPDHLIAAELSAIVYSKPLVAEKRAMSLGLKGVSFVEVGDTQALIAGKFVAFRGTESFGDIRDDLRAGKKSWRFGGKVHTGFFEAFHRIRGSLRLPEDFVFVGHSLGGAIATLAASYFKANAITFGCPRVGNRRFVRSLAKYSNVVRYVNNNDAVTRIPPAFLGFIHTPGCHLITWNGLEIIHNPSAWCRFKDRVVGRWKDIGKLGTDGAKDHRMDNYLSALRHAAR